MKKAARPDTVAAYLAARPPDQRAALQHLRRTIRAIVPRAEECISYGLPAFRLDGRMLVWYGASTKHCAFYPGGIPSGVAKTLAKYDTSKGTIRFQPEHALPTSLVRRLVRARMARNAAAARRRR